MWSGETVKWIDIELTSFCNKNVSELAVVICRENEAK